MRQLLLQTLLVYLSCTVIVVNSQDPTNPFGKFIRRDPRSPIVPDIIPDDQPLPPPPNILIIDNPQPAIKVNFKIINFNSVLALDEQDQSSQAQNEAPGPNAKYAADSKKKFSSIWQYMAQNTPNAKQKVSPAASEYQAYAAGGSSSKDIVRDEIFSWWTNQIGENIKDENKLIKEKVILDNKTHKCYERTYHYVKSSTTTMNIDQPFAVLYPGSFIQGQSITIAGDILQRLPISTEERNPIDIDSATGMIASQVTPTADSVTVEIKSQLQAQQNDVWVGFATSETILTLFDALNFNYKVVEKLGLSRIKTSRIFVVLHQIINEYSPAMFSQDSGIFSDPIAVFLKDTFDIEKTIKLKRYLFWGPNNIPTYVSSVYYGRFLCISVQQNGKNLQIYQKVMSGKLNSNEISAQLGAMFKDPTMQAYGKGPFSQAEISLLKTNNFESFFVNSPSLEGSNKLKMTPIAFSLNDFRGKPVKFNNSFNYNSIQCEGKPPIPDPPVETEHKVFIQLTEMYWEAGFEISNNGGGFWRLFGTGDASGGVIQITKYLTKNETARDVIRVDSTVHKSCWLCISWRRVRLRVWFDAVDDAHLAGNVFSECQRCHSDSNAAWCAINKMTKLIQCGAN